MLYAPEIMILSIFVQLFSECSELFYGADWEDQAAEASDSIHWQGGAKKADALFTVKRLLLTVRTVVVS